MRVIGQTQEQSPEGKHRQGRIGKERENRGRQKQKEINGKADKEAEK